MHISKMLMSYKQAAFIMCNVPINYHFRHWKAICDWKGTTNKTNCKTRKIAINLA